MKKLILILCGFFNILQAQISGNLVTNDNTHYNNRFQSQQAQKLYLSDTSFLVEATVLKHVKADAYVIVFGLNQEAKTVQECNNRINVRVKNFISNAIKLGISEQDIYTDLLTQNRVYDYKKVTEQYMEEYLSGFELGKNVIIKYKKPELAEKLLSVAAQDSIFDLVKVDYIIEDISKIYDSMFLDIEEIIAKKKNRYVKLTNMQLKPQAQIYSESFNAYYPSELYKSYKAFTQNQYSNSYHTRDVKTLHKFQTFYYDHPKIANLDKEIFYSGVEPTIDVVLEVQVKYYLEKQ